MSVFKIKDLAIEISDRINDPKQSGYDRFVGLEHYDSGNVRIIRYGDASKMQSSAKAIQKGDVLIARRNVYLKRAGIVDFDGLTSGDSIVLRAKNETIRNILPFIFNTDKFWKYANKYSDGSMSKRLSPKILMEYEVDLPDNDEDIKRLACLLWSIRDTLDSYEEMLKQCDELVKGQFVEMFGKVNRSKQIKVLLSEVVTIINGKDHKKISGSGEYGVYGTGGRMLDAREYMCDENTIIVGRKGTINKPYIVHEKCWIVDTAFGLYPKTNKLSINYLYYFIKQIDFNKLNKACTLPSLTKSDLSHLEITIPSIEEQNEFEKYVKHLDKSKFAIKEAMENVLKIKIRKKEYLCRMILKNRQK